MGFIFVLYCAQGGTRTHTALRPGNFKSPASTIPPLGQTKTHTGDLGGNRTRDEGFAVP